MHRPPRMVSFVHVLILFAFGATATADEGMWLFNNPPRKLLQEKYGFTPSDAWLAHLQQSAVRFNDGGSGAFVSGDGLVMTNHHVGADALQKLSTPERDLLKSSFHARTAAEELKCPDSELNVLVSIEDVTARVNAAVKPAADLAEADRLRRATIAAIEKESFDATGLRSDVVALYQGGLYHLYRYKKYTDVRLVFAPEEAIAFFGGDPDNFEYPRCDLDICFFRVYENGKPVKTPQHLKWNPASLREGDLTFIAGHPGHTERAFTLRHLETVRDRVLPAALDRLRRREVLLTAFSQRSDESARRAHDMLLGVQNSRKAHLGGLDGLQDPAVMARKRAEEQRLRHALERFDTDIYDRAFTTIDRSLAAFAATHKPYELLEHGWAFDGELFGIARTLVRLADEAQKPNAQRLPEFRESHLDSLKLELFSEAPIYADLETALLADSLSMYLEQTAGTPGQALAVQVMAGKSPQQRAAALVGGTRLADAAQRRRLAEGGAAAIEASDDPMIRLARLVDKPAREVRTRFEQQVSEPQQQAYGKLANIRFALRATETYPDATFTLRLAFGRVERCMENGRPAPAWTTFGDLFRTAEEHHGAEPYALPKSWLDRRGRLDMATPLNFVCTADIIGGNSGSPVVNRAGELVGIVFDGDLPSLVWDYVYTEPEGRAIAVHGSAILEALRKVYDAGPLADELERGNR
jgi:hypothetical protein